MANLMPRMLQIGFNESRLIPILAIAGIVACAGSYFCGVLDGKAGPEKAIIITQIVGILSLIFTIIGGFAKQSANDGAAVIFMYISLPFLGFILAAQQTSLFSLQTAFEADTISLPHTPYRNLLLQ